MTQNIDPYAPAPDAPPLDLPTPPADEQIESELLRVARIVDSDVDLRDRVRVALAAEGVQAASMDALLTWLLASEDLALEVGEGTGLAAGESLVSLASVTATGPELARTYVCDSSGVRDDLIRRGIEVAYRDREQFGLPLSRPGVSAGA